MLAQTRNKEGNSNGQSAASAAATNSLGRRPKFRCDLNSQLSIKSQIVIAKQKNRLSLPMKVPILNLNLLEAQNSNSL
jgi:hypothetical protein